MVEWKKLGEVCDFIKGRSLSKNDVGLGNAPIILYGELYTTYGEYIKDIKSATSADIASSATPLQEGDLVLPVSSTTKEAQIGKVSVIKTPENVVLGSDAIILRNSPNAAFLMYYINSTLFEKEKMGCVNGTTIMHLSPKKLSQKIIPIPPLAEQERIVGILDTFTDSIENLKKQIEQRRKQYEYYRDQLLDIEGKEGVEMKTLGDLCKVGDGLHGTPVYNEDGDYYFVNGNNLSKGKIVIKNDTKKVDDSMFAKFGMDFEDNTIFMSINGTIGNIAIYNGEKILLGKSAAYFMVKENSHLIYKYLYYILQTQSSFEYYNNKLTGSTIKNLGLKALREFPIPLPSLEEQSRIVSILDTFEASISNLEAQLEQRQKQYEYYRNQLLTFE